MYRKILVALENSRADASLLPHIEKLAKLMHSQLLLVHVADGWVARNFNQLKLAESEEMKTDRAYLETAAARLRKAGLEVNAADSKGYTALHGAAYRGLDDIIQYLVQKGAKLDAKDKEGRTPATLAEGTYLAGNPPEKRSSTLALIQKLATPNPQ